MNNKVTALLLILSLIASFLAGSFWTRVRYLETRDQKLETREPTPTPTPSPPPTTIGNFLITDKEICQENDQPIVYFFGSKRCPHCNWEHPIVEEVMAKFKEQTSFHNNMDKPGQDREIWDEYSDINPRGAIPFLVLGCKYARLGSGEGLGEEEEKKALSAIICKLTGGKPEEVCELLQEIIP